eukprot:scaffold537_cov241-Pinguiococcus_pyrenoidosus.AAC.3
MDFAAEIDLHTDDQIIACLVGDNHHVVLVGHFGASAQSMPAVGSQQPHVPQVDARTVQNGAEVLLRRRLGALTLNEVQKDFADVDQMWAHQVDRGVLDALLLHPPVWAVQRAHVIRVRRQRLRGVLRNELGAQPPPEDRVATRRLSQMRRRCRAFRRHRVTEVGSQVRGFVVSGHSDSRAAPHLYRVEVAAPPDAVLAQVQHLRRLSQLVADVAELLGHVSRHDADVAQLGSGENSIATKVDGEYQGDPQAFEVALDVLHREQPLVARRLHGELVGSVEDPVVIAGDHIDDVAHLEGLRHPIPPSASSLAAPMDASLGDRQQRSKLGREMQLFHKRARHRRGLVHKALACRANLAHGRLGFVWLLAGTVERRGCPLVSTDPVEAVVDQGISILLASKAAQLQLQKDVLLPKACDVGSTGAAQILQSSLDSVFRCVNDLLLRRGSVPSADEARLQSGNERILYAFVACGSTPDALLDVVSGRLHASAPRGPQPEHEGVVVPLTQLAHMRPNYPEVRVAPAYRDEEDGQSFRHVSDFEVCLQVLHQIAGVAEARCVERQQLLGRQLQQQAFRLKTGHGVTQRLQSC